MAAGVCIHEYNAKSFDDMPVNLRSITWNPGSSTIMHRHYRSSSMKEVELEGNKLLKLLVTLASYIL